MADKKSTGARRGGKRTRPPGVRGVEGGAGHPGRPLGHGLAMMVPEYAALEEQREKEREAVRAREREDACLGREQRVRETWLVGHEPAWLCKAKQVYAELGTCLSLVSHRAALPEWKLPSDVESHCRARLDKMLKYLGGARPKTLELRLFLGLLDDAAHRRGIMADAEEPIGISLAVAVGAVRANIMVGLLTDHAALDDLLVAWAQHKPTGHKQKSKFRLAAEVWNRATGRSVTAQDVEASWRKEVARRRKTSPRAR